MDLVEKRISAQALLALKEALANIYWYKNDCRSFIELTINNPTLVSTIDWTNTKYESVSLLIDRMAKKQDMFQKDLLKLIRDVGNFDDFSHLNHLEDKVKKINKAKESVQKLRNQTKGYFDAIEQLQKSEQARAKTQTKIKETINSQERLEALKQKFLEISGTQNHQKRGLVFEKFLNELFIYFDLDPKSSFKIVSEQIDGSFTFENTDYLLEAKWQQELTNAQDLYGFSGKIQGKFKNTCGLYISLGGYSPECTKTDSSSVKALILMDGFCLMQVLEGRIKLNEMLYLKRRHSSQTGEIFLRIKGV